jgi:hypothetical protein
MDFGADGINVELWQLFSRVAHEAAIEGSHHIIRVETRLV